MLFGEVLVKVEDQLCMVFGDQFIILWLVGLVGGVRYFGCWFVGKEGVFGGEQYINLVFCIDVSSICVVIIEFGYWGYILNVCVDGYFIKVEFYLVVSVVFDLDFFIFIIDFIVDRGKCVDN